MCAQLLGDSLFEVRKQRNEGRLDLPTVKAVGLSTLAAIESLHTLGFIHRDIKPANFVISPPNAAASRGGVAFLRGSMQHRCMLGVSDLLNLFSLCCAAFQQGALAAQGCCLHTGTCALSLTPPLRPANPSSVHARPAEPPFALQASGCL
jgi:serine/threonine protein kinase